MYIEKCLCTVESGELTLICLERHMYLNTFILWGKMDGWEFGDTD